MAIPFDLDTQAEFSDQTLKKLRMPGRLLNEKTFERCTFSGCGFVEAIFAGCKFRECRFKDCDLRLARLMGSTFIGTEFEKSNLTGIDWTLTQWSKGGLFTPVHFSECDISLCSFFGLDLSKTRIVRCIAKEAVFAEANMTRAVLTGTDFTDSRFLHTDLTEADFTDAKNYSIASSANHLKRTHFSLPEAIRLLSDLDIVITNPTWPS